MDSLLVAYFDTNDTQFNSHRTHTHKNTTRSIQDTKRFNLKVPDGLITPVALCSPGHGNQELIFHQILWPPTAVTSMSTSTNVHKDATVKMNCSKHSRFSHIFYFCMFIMSKSNVTRGSQSGKKVAQSSLELKLLISGPSIRQIKLNLKWEIFQDTLVKSKKKNMWSWNFL